MKSLSLTLFLSLLLSVSLSYHFGVCLLCSKLKTVGQSLWVNQHDDAIHSPGNLQTECRTGWHSIRKRQYEDFSVFRYQLGDRFIFISMKTKHPFHIMVFEVVTLDGDVLPLFIFLHVLRLKPEAYIVWLEEIVPLVIERMVGRRPYIWQKDSAPCHRSRRVQCWLL